jgi:hypothetical protein
VLAEPRPEASGTDLGPEGDGDLRGPGRAAAAALRGRRRDLDLVAGLYALRHGKLEGAGAVLALDLFFGGGALRQFACVSLRCVSGSARSFSGSLC